MPRQPYDFRRYLNVRTATAPSFSPDGKRLTYLSDVTGVPQVWSVPVEGDWPDQLTFYDERVGQASVAPDRDEIVFTMDHGGDERFALYLLRRDGADIVPLTDRPAAIHQLGGWSHDGRSLAYAANTRHQSYFDVYVLSLDALDAGGTGTGEPRRVLEQDGTNYALGWTPGGRVIASRTYSLQHNALYLVDPARTGGADGAPLLLTPDLDEAYYGSPVATSDERGLYLVTDLRRDVLALVYLDLATLEVRVIDAPDWDVEEVVLTRDGRLLAYAVNVDGYSELRLRDTVTGAMLPVPALPSGAYTQLVWSPDGRRLAFTLNGARDNPDIWVLDIAEGRAWQVTHSARGGIPREDLAEPEIVRYPTFDGRAIPALFFPPRSGDTEGRAQGQQEREQESEQGQGFAAVVEVHGGPESQRRPVWSAAIQYLVGRGYAVLSPNVRGSTGYGKAYSHLDDVRLRMDAVRDLAHAVEWLRGQGADPRRIAVMGASYGGFMVLSAITAYPDLWAAAVDIVGIANLVSFLEHTGPWRRALREQEYGSLAHDRAFLKDISPLHRAGDIRAPLLVIHGANDPRVPVGEAEQIVRALAERERPVEYLRFEDEGHGLVKLPNRIKGYSEIGLFLDRWLRPTGL